MEDSTINNINNNVIMENSIINNINNNEDEIQPVNNEKVPAEDEEQCQLLLNISLDKIENGLADSIHTDSESLSSSSSVYQMTTMEKFSFIATRILYSKYFQYYYFFIIILSVISFALSFILECGNIYHLIFEALIILALIIEVTICLLAQRKYFFYSFWNIIDVLIIINCVWLFEITENNCEVNDSIIDNGILGVRYIIQFIRLGLLLKKNKSSGGDRKRKSINFNNIKGKRAYYGSFNPYIPYTYSSSRKGKRKELSNSKNNIKYDENGNTSHGNDDDNDNDDGLSNYHNNSTVIDPNIYATYSDKYGSFSIDDPNASQFYNGGSIPNESFMSPLNNNNILSQSFIKDYSAFLQESNGSIDTNIDSNANLVKMFFNHENSGDDIDNKKKRYPSINSVNNEIYQKLIHSNIENNSRNINGGSGLPPPSNNDQNHSHQEEEKGLNIPSTSTQQTIIAGSNDSLSTNPIETPSSLVFSPISPQFHHYKSQNQNQNQNQNQPLPKPQPRKSISSSIHTDTSFSITLPPKIGKKPNRIAQTNHSSTFAEVPNRINLLTPILYGSPGTFSSKKN
ncbi:hypothetical protein BCR32DRAFT_266822 [Anaeromyces robustus]|uniref:Ion transport domain-containing protein n=1 Tax=Anaeromyces robustus TaxID=1754192 RepID=A0A1Y1XD71_9FUNG|nr:hypothetical protein BCR32DRAFT_266822 [Anaeromyces robustus]|eukprot:ORX83675.1 hypothetical protein BCR32DRAFT_266822 [Anaeromyces robustus]